MPERASSDARGEVMRTLHQTLQAARGSTVFEATGCATLFLTTVSSAIVAIAFVGQTTELGPGFYTFTYIVLVPVTLVGVVTFLRLVQTGVEDAMLARGIGRILHFYAEQDPGIADYLIQPAGDDDPSVFQMYGHGSWWQPLFTSASMVGAVTASLVAVIGGLVASQGAGFGRTAAALVGAAIFLAVCALGFGYQRHAWQHADREVPSRFPAREKGNQSQR